MVSDTFSTKNCEIGNKYQNRNGFR